MGTFRFIKSYCAPSLSSSILGVAFLRAFLRGPPPRFPRVAGRGGGIRFASSSDGSGAGCSGTSKVSGFGVTSITGAGCSDVNDAERLRFGGGGGLIKVKYVKKDESEKRI